MYTTYIVIGITVAISMYAFSNQKILRSFILNPYYISNKGEYHRFVTSGFIHADHIHLIMNMISLYFFGVAVERVFTILFGDFGTIHFLALYILGIIVSDVPTYLKNRGNPGYNSLGASGGVSAVIFAFIIFQPLSDICLYFALCMPGFILGTLYIIFSWYQGRKSDTRINHDAHLYGALFGLIYCAVVFPRSLPLFVEQIRNWDFLQKIF